MLFNVPLLLVSEEIAALRYPKSALMFAVHPVRLQFAGEKLAKWAWKWCVPPLLFSKEAAFYWHVKNLMTGCFGSHKKLSLNETIRMMTLILIFLIMIMFPFFNTML